MPVLAMNLIERVAYEDQNENGARCSVVDSHGFVNEFWLGS